MTGVLTQQQIFQVLHQQLYGRLACVSKNKVYVVPVSYAFDEKFIYAHSREGQKIQMLRSNPKTCFQVDIIKDLANWRSVIIWGRYQELTSIAAQNAAMRLLDDRFGPLHVSQSISRPSANVNPPHSVEKRKKAVYFRISIDEVTGRFENVA